MPKTCQPIAELGLWLATIGTGIDITPIHHRQSPCLRAGPMLHGKTADSRFDLKACQF